MLGYKNDLRIKNFVYFFIYNRLIKLNTKFDVAIIQVILK